MSIPPWYRLVEGYSHPQDVYVISNENPIPACKEIRRRATSEPRAYFGVLAGIDSWLSHLGQMGAVSIAVLSEVNQYAIRSGLFRLDLTTYCPTPIQYIETLFPGLDIRWIKGEVEAQRIASTNRLYQKCKFQYDPGKRDGAFNFLGYPQKLRASIEDIILRADGSLGFKTETGRVQITYDAASLIYQACTEPTFWLYIDDDTNYQKAVELYRSGRIKIVHMPFQTLGLTRLRDIFLDYPLGYVYWSNLNYFMGDWDFRYIVSTLNGLQAEYRLKKLGDFRVICTEPIGEMPNRILSVRALGKSGWHRPHKHSSTKAPDIIPTILDFTTV
jgi:hypothetical protein